jgi:hypothetical protein
MKQFCTNTFRLNQFYYKEKKLDEINSNFENLTSDSTKNLNEQLQEKQNILAKLQVDLNLEKAEKVK